MSQNTMQDHREPDEKKRAEASEASKKKAFENTLRKPLCPADGKEHAPMTDEETEFFGVCSGE